MMPMESPLSSNEILLIQQSLQKGNCLGINSSNKTFLLKAIENNTHVTFEIEAVANQLFDKITATPELRRAPEFLYRVKKRYPLLSNKFDSFGYQVCDRLRWDFRNPLPFDIKKRIYCQVGDWKHSDPFSNEVVIGMR